MLNSLFVHNRKQAFRVFVLVPMNFSDENKQKMSDSLSRWGQELHFLPVDETQVSGLKCFDHITAATYFRLYVVDLLPRGIQTALYLDADVIVNDCISELLNLDVSAHILAAVTDPLMDHYQAIRTKIGLKNSARYLNAGVMMINLERWRSDKIGLRALQFARLNPEGLTTLDQCALNHVIQNDQCALNHVIQGNYLILDQRWNLQRHHFTGRLLSDLPALIREGRMRPAVIHFTTEDKPWFFRCTHPMKHLYFEHLKSTAWHDFKEPDRTLQDITIKVFRTFRNITITFLETHLPYLARQLKVMHTFKKGVLSKTRTRVWKFLGRTKQTCKSDILSDSDDRTSYIR